MVQKEKAFPIHGKGGLIVLIPKANKGPLDTRSTCLLLRVGKIIEKIVINRNLNVKERAQLN